jgi:phosphinothricin acetyltransferase
VDVSVYVAPEARRQGVARRLYRSLFEVLATQGYCGAFAGVTLPNDPSVRLHRSVGFMTLGTYHSVGFKFGRWLDVMWLERRLRPADSAPAEPRPLS